ncbi:MAG: 2Fe-2S iron-sulfur cluster-binding protein [Thermoleophilia bacterium]
MAEYARVDLAAENQVTFELNGQKVTAPTGTMLADACYAYGVEIPIFCYEPRLGPPIGACRMCLVEVEGMRGLVTACSTPVAADMVVRTTTPAVVEAQDGVLELLLANHPLDCPVCDKGGECPLQDRTFKFGPGKSRFLEPKRHQPKPLELSRRIALDRERCIACYRCVRFSQEVAQDGELTMQERGGRSEITTFTGDDYMGRFSGNVIDICPVGALTSIPYRFVGRPWDVENTPSVCGPVPRWAATPAHRARERHHARHRASPTPTRRSRRAGCATRAAGDCRATTSTDRIQRAVVREAAGDREATLEDAVDAAAALLRGRRVGILVGGAATVEEAGIAQDLARRVFPGSVTSREGAPGQPGQYCGRCPPPSWATWTAPTWWCWWAAIRPASIRWWSCGCARRAGSAPPSRAAARAHATWRCWAPSSARPRCAHRGASPTWRAPSPTPRRRWCCGTRPTWPTSPAPPPRWPPPSPPTRPPATSSWAPRSTAAKPAGPGPAHG